MNKPNIIDSQNLAYLSDHVKRLCEQLTMLESITTETQSDNQSSASPSESKFKETMKIFHNTYADLLLLLILNEPRLSGESPLEININWHHVNNQLTMPKKMSCLQH